MDEAIEDGVGEGRLADDLVPASDRELAGDQRRAAAVAVLDDLHQIAPLVAVRRSGPQSSRISRSDLAEAAEQPREAAVAVGELEIGEQPRQALVEDGESVAAGLLAERAGEPRLADAAGPGDEQIAVLGDPLAGGELLEQRRRAAAACGSRRPRRRPGRGAAWRRAAGSGSGGPCARRPRGRAAAPAIRRGSRAWASDGRWSSTKASAMPSSLSALSWSRWDG